MEKKTINLIDINDDNINSALFLKYIKSYGFDPICYNNILELFQSVKGSMSQFLSSYKTYLLSSSVNYDELDKFKMNGALGYIEKDNICIPKNLVNDDRFYKKLNMQGNYLKPNINDFDVIIANGISSQLYNISRFNQDIYLGICIDSNNKSKDSIFRIYKSFKDLLNNSSNEYTYDQDKISTLSKELCIVKKK